MCLSTQISLTACCRSITTAIVFGCIAIACLVGIFVVLLIPTKDKKTR